MSASLILSALRVLECKIEFSKDGNLKIKSPNVPMSDPFLSLIQRYKEEIKFLSKLRCPICRENSVCEEGTHYILVYCPNDCDYMEFEAKGNFTEIEARAERKLIEAEAAKRLTSITSTAHDQTETLNKLCRQIITNLFTGTEINTELA